MIKVSKKNIPHANNQIVEKQGQIINWAIVTIPIIILGIIAIYWQSLSFDFTNLDDRFFIIKNDTNTISIKELLQCFNRGCFYLKDAYYRPLLMIYFKIINYNFGSHSLFWYHAANIFFHCINVILLFTFLNQLNANKKTNILLIFLFAFHPAFTMAIAWVPGVNDLLLTAFATIFFTSILKYIESKNLIYSLFSVLSFTAALFVKEIGVFLPIVALGLVYFKFGFNEIKSRRFLFANITFILLILLWYFMRQNVLDKASSHIFIKEWFYILPSRSVGVFHYLFKTFIPINLCVLPNPNNGDDILHITLSILIFLGFGFFVFFKKNKNEIILFSIGFLWFCIFLMPIFFMPYAATIKLFEHRLYLPIIGILIALMPLINYAIEKKIKLVLIVGSVITVFYCFQIINYLPSFSDSFEFYKNAALLSPNSAREQLNFGKALAEKNDFEQAKKYINLSLKLDSNVHYTRYYLALYKYIPEQKWDSALVLLHHELKLSPGFANNYLEISRCYLSKNNYIKSEEYLEKYCKILPEDTRMVNFMLKLYLQNNHIEKAKNYTDYLIKNSIPVDTSLLKIVNQNR